MWSKRISYLLRAPHQSIMGFPLDSSGCHNTSSVCRPLCLSIGNWHPVMLYGGGVSKSQILFFDAVLGKTFPIPDEPITQRIWRGNDSLQKYRRSNSATAKKNGIMSLSHVLLPLGHVLLPGRSGWMANDTTVSLPYLIRGWDYGPTEASASASLEGWTLRPKSKSVGWWIFNTGTRFRLKADFVG